MRFHRRPEFCCKFELGLRRQVLIAKKQYEVLHQRVVDLIFRILLECLRQIDTADLGADSRRYRGNIQLFVQRNIILRRISRFISGNH